MREAADDAGRRNMALLVQLRWLAVGGQLLTIAVVHLGMGITLPLTPLVAAAALLAAINVASEIVLRRDDRAIGDRALFAALLFDVAVLAWQLRFTGGLANPFVWLFLLQVVIGALVLRGATTWGLVSATLLAVLVLAIWPVPLALPSAADLDPLTLYLIGNLVCFVLTAVLLAAFVTRVARNLRARDAALASLRQRAAEEEHILRMGLLASGAAHELGTPLATLSVLIGDWRAAADAELADDLADMDAAVRRCKAIVGRVLLTAGEARGEAPARTTMRAFLAEIVAAARDARAPATLDYRDAFGEDVAIIADPALRQVIGNVLDNAAEASPDWVGVVARRDGAMLLVEVSDRGPGFAPEMLAGFGQPYRSTKGRPGGGLGLFLLVNVLRTLGGEARAENLAGGGARVTIALPIAAVARA